MGNPSNDVTRRAFPTCHEVLQHGWEQIFERKLRGFDRVGAGTPLTVRYFTSRAPGCGVSVFGSLFSACAYTVLIQLRNLPAPFSVTHCIARGRDMQACCLQDCGAKTEKSDCNCTYGIMTIESDIVCDKRIRFRMLHVVQRES